MNTFKITKLDTSSIEQRYRIRSPYCDIEISEKIKEFLDYIRDNNGKSIEEIFCNFLKHNQNIDKKSLLKLIQVLLEKKILVQDQKEIDSGEQLQSQCIYRNRMSNLLFRKRLINTDKYARFFALLSFPLKKHILFSILGIYLVLDAILLYLYFFTGWGKSLIYFSAVDYFFVFILFPIVIMFFHEIGHIAAMKKYGLPTPEGMGFGLYFSFVVFYSDTHEAWNLPRKERMLVSSAGFLYSIIATIPLFIVCFSLRSATIKDFLLLFHLSVIGIFNPFLKMDGYWLLSDILGIPSLHTKIKVLLEEILLKMINFKRTILNPFSSYPKHIRKGVYIYICLYYTFMVIFLSIFASTAIRISITFDESIIYNILFIISNKTQDTEWINSLNLLLRNSFILLSSVILGTKYVIKTTKLATNKGGRKKDEKYEY